MNKEGVLELNRLLESLKYYKEIRKGIAPNFFMRTTIRKVSIYVPLGIDYGWDIPSDDKELCKEVNEVLLRWVDRKLNVVRKELKDKFNYEEG